MGDLCLFLNTEITSSGFLAGVGDLCLSPVRYWCYGNTVEINDNKVHHVQSYHEEAYHHSRTSYSLQSSGTSMLTAIATIILFVPGLFLGVIFKTFAYLYSEMQERHNLAKRHFIPIVRHLGTPENPIATEYELSVAVSAEKERTPHNPPTDAIVIHGRNLAINKEPFMMLHDWNPMKLILEGARIVHQPCAVTRLDDAMASTRKWEVANFREIRSHDEVDKSFAQAQTLPSLEEALADVPARRGWLTCKRWHRVYTIRPPQAPAPAAV